MSGAQITFAYAPQPGDILTADVFTLQTVIDGAAPATGTDQIKYRQAAPIEYSNKFSGATVVGDPDGTNTVFGLAFGPTIFGVLDGVNAVFTTGVYMQRMRVYRNGQMLTLNIDCAAYGNSVVFFGDQIPRPGDLILILGWL